VIPSVDVEIWQRCCYTTLFSIDYCVLREIKSALTRDEQLKPVLTFDRRRAYLIDG
jgi:hypothetical protein